MRGTALSTRLAAVLSAAWVGSAGASSEERFACSQSPWPFDSADVRYSTFVPDNFNEYNVTEWWDTTPQFTDLQREHLMAGTSGEDNLCLSDDFGGQWLVPELVVIGGIKSATTTFSRSLQYSPGVLFPLRLADLDSREWPAAWKEGHYFDTPAPNNEDYRLMISDYGKCDRTKRWVSVDASARYSVDAQVPAKIRFWYRDLSRKVKFVMLLREPVARMHSHYWHGKECKWCSHFYRYSFQQVVDYIFKYGTKRYEGGVRVIGPDRGCADFIEGSVYTRQIRTYFQHFETDQFMFIPMKFVTEPGELGRPEESPAKHIWKALGVRGLQPPTSLNANSRQHPSLFDDLKPKDIMRLNSFFEALTSPVMIAELLVGTKARLYGLKRTNDFPPALQIASWIQDNW